MPAKIIWTKIDEAPALATYALLPVLQAYAKGTGVDVETSDISLAGRIIANFPENLAPRISASPTTWARLASWPRPRRPTSSSCPTSAPRFRSCRAAIKELQAQGYDLPDYPEEPKTEAEKALQARFAKVLGCAVNPVLREGNADRRAAVSVKKFAQKNPHKMMKDWPAKGSKCRVAHMTEKDFYGSETSITVASGHRRPDRVRRRRRRNRPC